MALLEHLDRARWKEIHDALGPATVIPDLLRWLAEPSRADAVLATDAVIQDRPVLEMIQNVLWHRLLHEGARNEASVAAIPFLVQLLKDGPPGPRPFLISLLHGLGVGEPLEELPPAAPTSVELRALLEAWRFGEALAGVRRALGRKPRDQALLACLARALAGLGRHVEALAVVEVEVEMGLRRLGRTPAAEIAGRLHLAHFAQRAGDRERTRALVSDARSRFAAEAALSHDDAARIARELEKLSASATEQTE